MAIQIISASSILGLMPTGVEGLADSLLSSGLLQKLQVKYPLVQVQTFNAFYSGQRDAETNCLNGKYIKDFAISLSEAVSSAICQNRLPLVLGGDCSILLGTMLALKMNGDFGLIFMDAHADFYEPEKSVTGQVADMDLAIVTGRGPDILTNIKGQKPYVKDRHVIHIGQRDWEETRKYGSQDIKATSIKCIDCETIKSRGITSITKEISKHLNDLDVAGFWIHFDTDVLSDDINPAVDYRLPGGLSFEETEFLLKSIFSTGKVSGMSITIFNPTLDENGSIAAKLTDCISRSFQ